MTLDDFESDARARQLTILGGFHPTTDDKAPEGCRTLLMLGPAEPKFWPAFIGSPEYLDGLPDPMDRWSARVIDALAKKLGATALYPFGGPPYLPFFSWALRTGRIHSSPIMLLVHDTAGLFVSFRGALALSQYVDLPDTPPNPCASCTEQPCRTACPVDAFDGTIYNVSACKTYLGSETGRDCVVNGCAARRTCPVSAMYPRLAEQSAFHMAAFKG